MEIDKKVKDYMLNSIAYFRKYYLKSTEEISYNILEDGNGIKFKIPKSLFNEVSTNLKTDDFDFEIIPAEKKMELMFPRHNGKKLLKTQPFKFIIYFVEPVAIKDVTEIKDKESLNIKTWADFFEIIDPEYKNLMKKIIDNISIAVHKNEYNKVISKKTYFLDFTDGLFERKEKFVNDEWKITYQPVTSNIHQVFRMFFKFFDQIDLNELADFELFKRIVSQTKYKYYLED